MSLQDDALSRVERLASYKRRAFCAAPLHRQISMPQLYLLTILQERGPMTVSELASLLETSAPSASALLDRLEGHGLVERQRDDCDRRVVHVRSTDAGRSVVEEAVGVHRQRVRTLFEAMSEDELRDVIRGLDAIEAVLAREGVIAQSRSPEYAG